jgi:hypothetical protein
MTRARSEMPRQAVQEQLPRAEVYQVGDEPERWVYVVGSPAVGAQDDRRGDVVRLPCRNGRPVR